MKAQLIFIVLTLVGKAVTKVMYILIDSTIIYYIVMDGIYYIVFVTRY